ncbi:hypothetical protein NQG63_07985 [Exiguobacterium himgiriensis]|uniref:hypothetical protein n=2 Tax=Exiguobacterium TaxID=33986 RepID=UPI002036E25D|nr:hypothetical protein [Exiguobacterium sp. s122]MCT4783184.1 hypothetical protein [Exiguobacterium himgiriensis]
MRKGAPFMKNSFILLTIVSALSSQILPQILFLAVMGFGEGASRVIPFMIFYVASMSGLLVWIYVIGRMGSKRAFLMALFVLAIGLVCWFVPFAWGIEMSAFLVGVGSIGVGTMMTTILSQLKEFSPKNQGGSALPLVVLLVSWIALFLYTFSRSYDLAVLLFLISLVLPWLFVRKLPLTREATWTFSTTLFLRAFLVVTVFTLLSRLVSLLEGTRGYLEIFFLTLLLVSYMVWLLLQRKTRNYVTTKSTRQVQFLAYAVGLFGGWTLIGAVFTSLALYSFNVLLFYVFVPFLFGVIGWILFGQVVPGVKRPYSFLLVSSAAFFLGFWHPIAFLPVLFVNGYIQTMYSSIGHMQLYTAYRENKEFAALVMQLWKKFGMVVAQVSLMLGILAYGLTVDQTVNTDLSFALPKSWMVGVLAVTWTVNVAVITVYWRQIVRH